MATVIKSNERVAIAGKTRSGKTTLARHLAKPIWRLLVFDSKRKLTDWNTEPWGEESRNKLLKGERARVRLVPEYNQDPNPLWEEGFDFAMVIGDCTIVIDEAFSVFEKPYSVSPTARSVWTQGAEFGVGVIACTQRPAGIPLFILSESEYYFCFRLTLAKDRERMSEFMGEEVKQYVTDKHGFYFYSVDESEPIYVSGLDIDEKSKESFNERSTTMGLASAQQ